MLRPYQKINRRKTRVVNVGNVLIGGDNPISVQTMTNTITADVQKTINQINSYSRNLKNIFHKKQLLLWAGLKYQVLKHSTKQNQIFLFHLDFCHHIYHKV